MFYKKKINELVEKVNELDKKVLNLKNLLNEAGIKYVDNYFKDCPCCKNEPKQILLSNAKSFKKKEQHRGFVMDYYLIDIFYTTENSYKLHEKKIKEWEAEKI